MCATKVVVDFCSLLVPVYFALFAVNIPCRVKVIVCSSFSNSSVRVRFLCWDVDPREAMILVVLYGLSQTA